MAPNLSLYPSLKKLDYSSIHKENEILEENLEEHLGHIKRNERKAMEEKGEELDEMRRQIEVITKLQEAVNSRNPGDSTEFISNARATRAGRQWAGDSRQSLAQMKIAAEREKFSSKNLFNARRFRNSSEFDFLTSRKLVPPSAMQIPSDNEDENIYDDTVKNKLASLKQQQKPSQPKGYLKETFSSQAGFRPVTASVGFQREQKEDDLLPPRSKSAVLRSRSRRQLELLCRVTPKEDELQVTADFKIDWKVVNEKLRRRKLHQLKVEQEEILDKVNVFLKDVDLFNKRPVSGKPTEPKVALHNSVSENRSDQQETLSTLESETTSDVNAVQRPMSKRGTSINETGSRSDSAKMSVRNISRPTSGNSVQVEAT